MRVVVARASDNPLRLKFQLTSVALPANPLIHVLVAKLKLSLLLRKVEVPQESPYVKHLIPVLDGLHVGGVDEQPIYRDPRIKRFFWSQYAPILKFEFINRARASVGRLTGQNIIARDKVWFPIEFHKPSHGFAPILKGESKRIIWAWHARPRGHGHQGGGISLENHYPSALAANIGRDIVSCRPGLFPDFPKSIIGGVYATPADYNQKSSKESGSTCEDEHPSLNIRCVTFIVLCFGGIFLAFGPGMSLNNQRRVLRTSLVISGIGCCEIGLLFWFMTGVFPFSWGLPPRWLPAKWNPCKQSHHSQAFPHGVTVAQKLLTPPWFSYYTNYMANVLSIDKKVAVISALCEGSSIRSIERQTGIHRDTIMRLGVRVGNGCTALMNAKMRNLDCHRIEMDEVWGFIGKKDKHVHPDDDPQYGDAWTFCAVDSDTKLVPAFRVVKYRDIGTATEFVCDVADRMKNRLQISTDGLSVYVDAIERGFGRDVDYGQIIKTYKAERSIEAHRRYSPPRIEGIEKKAVFGRPDFDLISTSYVERLNATTRLHMRRLTRLTLAFSKKRENFEAAVGLHFAYYNFVLRHSTLRCTPAMAAGVEQSFWTVGDLIEAAA